MDFTEHLPLLAARIIVNSKGGMVRPALNTVGKGGSSKGAGAAWSPSDDADCVLWLAASNVNDTTEGNPVSTWTDNSGQSNDVTQASAARQPTYEVVGGIPVVRFDGSDQIQAASGVIDLTKKMSFFWIGTERILHTGGIIGTMNTVNGRYISYRGSGSIGCFVNASGYAYPSTGIAADTIATFSCSIDSYNGIAGGHQFRANGSEFYDNFSTTPSTTNDGNLSIGSIPNGAQGLDGDIADMIIINREADAALYANVSAYWSATYGL